MEPASAGSLSTANVPQANSGSPETVLPRLMKFSGVLHDASGNPLSGAVDITFSLYGSEAGSSPLWFETQSVQADESGRYTALLGVMHSDGLPVDLFTSGEVRWLGVQVGLEAEQARVLLVSVPYALKAGDAETLGGKPASAYMLSEAQSGIPTSSPSAANTTQAGTSGTTQKSHASNTTPLTSACASVTSNTGGTANYLAMFDATCDVMKSSIIQAGSNVGIGTATPGSTLHMVGNNSTLTISGTGTHQVNIVGATSGRLGQDAAGFFFSSDTNGAPIRFATNNGSAHEWMRITSAGNVGLGTIIPAHKLDVVGDINAVTSGTLTAIIGTNTGTDNDGVDGYATNPSGTGAGVYGESDSTTGYGVYGTATAATGTTYGVVGVAQTSPDGVGVFGQGNKWAAYFAGNMKINGAGNGINFPDGTKQITAASPTFGSFNTTSLFNNFPSANPAFIRINGNSSATANESYRASVMPVACTATNLTVASSGAANLSIILRVNGVSTALGCTISGGTACTDNAHTVAITPGNLLSLEFAGGSTGTIIYTAFTCG